MSLYLTEAARCLRRRFGYALESFSEKRVARKPAESASGCDSLWKGNEECSRGVVVWRLPWRKCLDERHGLGSRTWRCR
jgi:hypothetical protein